MGHFFRRKFIPKGSRLQFFSEFCDRLLKNPKGSSLSVFSALWDIFFHKRFPIHQYFDTLKSFCYFWALDMAPTWAGPGFCFRLIFLHRLSACFRVFVLAMTLHSSCITPERWAVFFFLRLKARPRRLICCFLADNPSGYQTGLMSCWFLVGVFEENPDSYSD